MGRYKHADTSIEVGWGPFKVQRTWTPNEAERDAAWQLLVELVTRTASVGQLDTDGSLREAMTSLYSLFETTRTILKSAGPSAAPNKRNGELSLGIVAVRVLNECIRPFLSHWHPRLKDHEHANEGSPAVAWEREWPEYDQCQTDLRALRETIRAYIDTLGRAAGTSEFADEVGDDIRRASA